MIKEDLLNSWINASLTFKANRYLDDASLNEMLVLKEIMKNENINASDLCERMHILKSQMSHLIDKMENKGYIKRHKDVNDERRVSLTITDLGINTYKKEHEIVLKIMSDVETKLGKKKTNDLCRLLYDAANAVKGKN